MQHNNRKPESSSGSSNSPFSTATAADQQQQQQQQKNRLGNRTGGGGGAGTAATSSFYDYRCVLSEMLFARLSFLPSLTYNMVLDKLGYRRWYDRIDKTVILGALPLTPKAKQLINEENISAVVSMNENYELRLCYGPNEWNACNVSFLQLPIVDLFEAPSQDKLEKGVAFIYKNAVSNASVYVHCKAGRTRSATLVGCYLMLRYNLNPDEAVTLLKEKRPHIFLKEKQLNALQEFYDKHIKGKK